MPKSSLPVSPPAAMSVASPGVEVWDYRELSAFFDAFSRDADKWRKRNRGYHQLVENVYRFHVPPGRSVLEIGCGTGDLLAALEPGHGVGIDLSREMVDVAERRHPTFTSRKRPEKSWISGRRSTSSFSRISFRMSTTWSASSTASTRTAGPIRA